ncbi:MULTISPECIES: hypothetical protein [Bacillus cereus group]|uniref:Uncharacterized protein n=2 Tax=Bacillus thuringiensis TaxID=1428 RepID=A0ABD5I9S0_BACTU|nr:hypothetical protein [Bacillus thuringiensis]AMR88267.1 hypothetical protein A3L20_30090 [Bacillus thuringiensis]MBG9636030.1 hypothetical protein [Bacillus thuringiensis]MBG9675925.1 hypothetical protein [Bacillus thuringiensis]MCR6784357.1 hypothetical protein [Bacillus thuringiensis]MCR6863110.1 hypothetical protein [Bacillus thuringiensis]
MNYLRMLPVYIFLGWSVFLATLIVTNKISDLPGLLQLFLVMITILGLIFGSALFFQSDIDKFNSFFLRTLILIGFPLIIYYITNTGLLDELLDYLVTN